MDIKELKNIGSKQVSRHPWELARLEVIFNIFKRKATELENTTIIDIGCGDTFFVEQFAERFPTVNFIAVDTAFDVDIIADFQERLKNKKIKLFDSLDKAEASITSNVSAIFLFDVVEHIQDDFGFLANIASRKFISPQTQVFITVPAFQSLFTSHDVFLGHFRRYNNTSLMTLVKKSGFRELEKGYFFSVLLLPRIIQMLKEKIFGQPEKPSTDLVEWKGGNFKTRAIKNILLLDYFISSFFRNFGIHFIGLSNYIVCMKSA